LQTACVVICAVARAPCQRVTRISILHNLLRPLRSYLAIAVAADEPFESSVPLRRAGPIRLTAANLKFGRDVFKESADDAKRLESSLIHFRSSISPPPGRVLSGARPVGNNRSQKQKSPLRPEPGGPVEGW
jgi:hypothetical protein